MTNNSAPRTICLIDDDKIYQFTAKRMIELEYDVLINVANWPERRSHAWKTLLQARAIENQSFVIGVNRVHDVAKDSLH